MKGGPETQERARRLALHAMKRRYATHRQAERVNSSPFDERVVSHRDQAPSSYHVDTINGEADQALCEKIEEVRESGRARVVILSGQPGAGKTHLLGLLRDGRRQAALDFVYVGGDNFWNVDELEAWLLDRLLAQLTDWQQTDLLERKLLDLVLHALNHARADRRALERLERRSAKGLAARAWRSVRRSRQALEEAIDAAATGSPEAVAALLERLDMVRVADYVAGLFLEGSPLGGGRGDVQPSNPFHKYVLHVLLRYLIPEQRDHVVHWLRGRRVLAPFVHKVHRHLRGELQAPVGGGEVLADKLPFDPDRLSAARQFFLRQVGVDEALDQRFKAMDTLKILLSLFSQDVTRSLSSEEGEARVGAAPVFVLAFDQVEARQALNRGEDDWLRFFSVLSELYNTLPNVLVVCTMQLSQREKLRTKLERQVQERISQDKRFQLRQRVPPEGLVALYRRRLAVWADDELRELLEESGQPCLPFEADEVLALARDENVRNALARWDEEFARRVQGIATEDPVLDGLIAFNGAWSDWQRKDWSNEHQFTTEHVARLRALFRAEPVRAAWRARYGVEVEVLHDTTSTPSVAGGSETDALALRFAPPERPQDWVRCFVVYFGRTYSAYVPGALALLDGKQAQRNLMTWVRCESTERLDAGERADQVDAQRLDPEQVCWIEAALRTAEAHGGMLDRDDGRERLLEAVWSALDRTYLGAMGERVRAAIEACEASGEEAGHPGDPDDPEVGARNGVGWVPVGSPVGSSVGSSMGSGDEEVRS